MTTTPPADWPTVFRTWLFDAALPLWASTGVDPASGGFQEAIGWDGAPAAAGFRRARVQGRQIYVYAVAGALGWPGPWRAVMRGGMAFVEQAFRRPDGLYRTRVTPQGAPLDETPHLYDQAFFLFAGAAAARAFPEEAQRLEAEALAHLDAVERHFARPAGGYVEASTEHPLQSNPHMHLFEAMLSWEDLTGTARWGEVADRIGELCLARFIDAKSGALREFFAPDWSPEPGEGGRVVEPGHQFEWAWLLMRWSRLRERPDAACAARRLFEIGVRHGVDPDRGVAINQLDDALQPVDRTARLWPQTERIKAALLLGDAQEVADACAGLQLYLEAAPRGLWRDRLRPDGSFVEEPAPASSFYHIICALNELFAAAQP